MKIQNVSDAAFKKYGKVITGLDCSDIIAAMAETPCPENVVYVPGAEPLESCASAKDIAYTLYGGMPVQIGYCNGNNHKLNGLEYHRDSEVNIAVTDLILLIGSEQDIENGKYDTSKVEAFLVPAGTVIEVYAPRCTMRRAMQTTAASSASSRCRRARTPTSKSARRRPRKTKCFSPATSGCLCTRKRQKRVSTSALSAKTSAFDLRRTP